MSAEHHEELLRAKEKELEKLISAWVVETLKLRNDERLVVFLKIRKTKYRRTISGKNLKPKEWDRIREVFPVGSEERSIVAYFRRNGNKPVEEFVEPLVLCWNINTKLNKVLIENNLPYRLRAVTRSYMGRNPTSYKFVVVD